MATPTPAETPPRSSSSAHATQREPKKPTGPVICVFCGSSSGSDPAHLASAAALAHVLASAGATLVYGGGTAGLMGVLARTLVSLSGPASVVGIIPAPLLTLERGTPDPERYGETVVVRDMHSRKRLMAQRVMEGGLGSGFVCLAGGYGTLEETMEMVTWRQLGIHARGVVVCNVGGYWDGVLAWVRAGVEGGFIGTNNDGLMRVVQRVEETVGALREADEGAGREDGKAAGVGLKLDWS